MVTLKNGPYGVDRSSRPTHNWTRPPMPAFVLVCGDCGREWQPDQRQPMDKCRPKPNADKRSAE